MNLWILTLAIVALALVLAYRNTPLIGWTAVAAGVLGWVQLQTGFSALPWFVFAVVAALLNIRPLRRQAFSRPLMNWFNRVLPPMSETERAAIDAGTVWWDAELFTGRPDWQKLLGTPPPRLSEEEQAFLDGPVETLCGMLNDWRITHELNDLPVEVWDYIKNNGFLGMIIPREYGGLGFSARGHSEVIVKIATRSVGTAVTVMVPNSLGPGELLLAYGTDEQKKHYLPRLASGKDIPCFALTNPFAGSDAGSIPDSGVVCKQEVDGKETLGFRLNWDKRYITLAPVASVMGLAFKAYDPDGLLGDTEDLGITCVLIPTDTAGVEIGSRHDPGTAFQNGPTRGKDVFVPLDALIGGPEMIGKGWTMLVESLSVGRAISLPAQGVANGKLTARMTGAYARIRRQFGIPIGQFEGVEEALARIGGLTYRMDAARLMTTGAIDLGERPSVLSAILKYHLTESMRTCLDTALDVHGGRGVCQGPRNYLAIPHACVPVAITVEGANILTRSMIIFGQGAIRCHPYLLTEMRAATDGDLATFDRALFAHIGLTGSNKVRALLLGLTGARLASAPRTGPTRKYYRQLTRMSAAFAFVADSALLLLGGELKRRERISARLGDVLSHLYLSSAVLKRHEDDGRPAADLAWVDWALSDSLVTIENSLIAVLDNFPMRWMGRLLKWVVFPFGRSYRVPSDKTEHQIARLMLEPSAARDRLTDGMYINTDPADPVGRIEHALERTLAAEPALRKLRNSLKKRIPPYASEQAVTEGLAAGVITDVEAQRVREWAEAVTDAIQVDEFEAKGASAQRAGFARAGEA